MAKDVAIVVSVATPPVLLVWRYVVRPRVIAPALAFHHRVERAVAAVERVEPVVMTMANNIGPNGGKSLIDKVNHLTARVSLLVDDLPWPTFEASGTGENTRVNHQFERAFGYSAADLTGIGWKNLLHHGDADDYFEAWAAAVADVRPFRRAARFVSRDGVTMSVLVSAQPVVNDSLTALLSEFDGVSVLGCVQEPAKVLALVQTTQPDVVILDLQTEQGIALQTLKQITKAEP